MNKKIIVYILPIVLILFSCDPESPNNPNDQEVITKIQINVFDAVDTVQFEFSDPDGPGGATPTVDTIFLSPSTTYTARLELLDETKTPVDTVTIEIKEESTAHQFFYIMSGGLNLTSTYSDIDDNFMPLGLRNTWNAGTASTGSVTITLRHGPDKNALGVSSGMITNAGGETDVEVAFPVVIQ